MHGNLASIKRMNSTHARRRVICKISWINLLKNELKIKKYETTTESNKQDRCKHHVGGQNVNDNINKLQSNVISLFSYKEYKVDAIARLVNPKLMFSRTSITILYL